MQNIDIGLKATPAMRISVQLVMSRQFQVE